MLLIFPAFFLSKNGFTFGKKTMFRRIALYFTFIVSLFWVGFSIVKNYQQGGSISIENAFNEKDENILVINRLKDFSSQLVANEEQYQLPFWQAFLKSDLLEQVAFSGTQEKSLWKFKENVSKSLVESVFGKEVQFKLGKIYAVFGKKAQAYKNYLLISPDESTRKKQNFDYDKKATASLLKNNKGNFEVVDIYLNSNGKVEYVSANSLQNAEKVNDAEYFAYVIPKSIEKYHFKEREYSIENDTVLKSSPMSNWLHTGFVEMIFMGEKIILTDYIDGADPSFLLKNVEGTVDTNWFSTPLTSAFPQKGKYTVVPIEDFVVIGENEHICNQFVANYKLGNTLALSLSKMKEIYGNLPRLSSERLVSNSEKWSKSVYNGKLTTTRLYFNLSKREDKMTNAISMPVNFTVSDFLPLSGMGNVVVSGKDGEITAFLNQKLAWSKKIEKINSIQLVDLLENGEEQILLSTEQKIYLFEKDGTNVNGFPIVLEAEMTVPPKCYRWKGEPFILVGNSAREIIQFDARGRERFSWKSPSKITGNINVWASQKKLFWGIQSEAEFIMFDAKKRKEHRRFSVKNNSIAMKVRNQLLHFQLNKEELEKVDQKGSVLKLASFRNGKLLNQNGNENFILKKNNEVFAFNPQGVSFAKIKIPFNEFSSIYTFQTDRGTTVFPVLDELENNIFLYSKDGKLLLEDNFEGKIKAIPTAFNGKLLLSTVVDDFIVQYLINKDL